MLPWRALERARSPPMTRTSTVAPLLVDVTTAGILLGISRRQVFSLMASGRLVRVRLGRRTTRIERASIERLIASVHDSKAR